MNRCDSCIHEDVCSRELQDPCGLYVGYCGACYHWEQEAGSSGWCDEENKHTYRHFFCKAYTDPEWVKKYYKNGKGKP